MTGKDDSRRAVVPLLADDELGPEAAAVFADIRATRGTDFVNAFWRALANDPALLRRTWESVKEVMAPGALDPLVKEMIYIAVSATNACDYCVNSHTAAARAKGMSEAQLIELVAVVGMANETNRLANALQVPVDEAFEGGGRHAVARPSAPETAAHEPAVRSRSARKPATRKAADRKARPRTTPRKRSRDTTAKR